MAGARFARALLVATLLLPATPASRSEAQVPAPEPIEQRLPEDWRAPLAQFLRDFGASEVDAIVEAAKIGRLSHLQETAILRLEHRSACFGDVCLTIIGQLKDRVLHPRAIFAAGKWLTRGDAVPMILGTNVFPPLIFYTTSAPPPQSKGVAVIETRRGWIVSTNPH